MREQDYAVNNSVQAEQLEVSRVLRNTYGLLALTLAFSGVMAFVAQQMRVGYPNIFVVLIGFYGLFFLTNKLRDSAWGLVSAFALTGFMGFLLGPILNRYLGMQGGAEVVSSAFAMTALVFGGLSAYVLITRKDMSFLGGFITAGFFVLLGATLASLFFQIVIVAGASYLGWFWLVRQYPATRLSSFSFLTPVMGVLAGGVLLGEPLTPAVFAALGLVGAGIWVANR